MIGHLTTRFYVGMFDDASYHLLFAVFGYAVATDERGETGWVDVQARKGLELTQQLREQAEKHLESAPAPAA